MKEFWNQRYKETEYAYGKAPNDFLKSISLAPRQKILCVAEGQGRNGVFLASQGHLVTCVDYAESGLEKAKALADENNVAITLHCVDLLNFDFGNNQWDAIVSIFGHFPASIRNAIHRKFYDALKPGGKLILEAYNKQQIALNTGGPKDMEMLYSKEELLSDFKNFDELEINELNRFISEGSYHHGMSSVVQVVGNKKENIQ